MNAFTRLAAAAALALAAASPAAAHDFTLGDLRIGHPWSRPGIPNRPAAAYAVISNAGAEPDRLVSASSPAFGAIELHKVAKDGDVMTMMKVDAIEAPAGGEVALEPGGFHIMLFDAARPFAEGESFPLTLTFERAGTIEVSVSVEKGGAEHDGHGHGDGHGQGHSHGQTN